LKSYAASNGRAVTSISTDAMGFLKSYGWPGNVRELENYIERAVVLAEADVLTPELLPSHVRGEAPQRVGRATRSDLQQMCTELVALGLSQATDDGAAHPHVMGLVERELILQVLRMCQGTQTRTASRLGINRNTLHKKIDEYALHSESR
jgi:DNA-binding NtrC family response regulator